MRKSAAIASEYTAESHDRHRSKTGARRLLLFTLASGGWVGDAAGGSGNQVYRRAMGGSIGTDTVPAMLTPGEFVVNRAASQANRGLLTAINAGGSGMESVTGLLRAIADKIDNNTAATIGQTVSINRETRLANRKRSAA